MKKALLFACIVLVLLLSVDRSKACSVVYYIDKTSGNIYVANNEDYWYDTETYIQIEPAAKDKLARLWYGWDKFAQGGINEAGLFFDGAVTPQTEKIKGYSGPKGNLGDDILARCSTVAQAIDFLEEKKIALDNAHMMFGDRHGEAAVIEWINGERKIIPIENDKLIMTNFLLSDPDLGNYPCPRYANIAQGIADLESSEDPVSLSRFGNVLGKAVQIPREDATGKVGGTLYSSFIDITNMEFVLVYKLDNQKITKLDLKDEFAINKKRKIELK